MRRSNEVTLEQKAERLFRITQRIGFALWQLQELEGVAAHYVVLLTQAMKGMVSPSDSRLKAHADTLGLYITVTRVAEANTTRERAALDLRFLAHDQTTSVELRELGRDGWGRARQAWPLIERCSQQLTGRPAPNPTAP